VPLVVGHNRDEWRLFLVPGEVIDEEIAADAMRNRQRHRQRRHRSPVRSGAEAAAAGDRYRIIAIACPSLSTMPFVACTRDHIAGPAGSRPADVS
jgi:hypothetical protein